MRFVWNRRCSVFLSFLEVNRYVVPIAIALMVASFVVTSSLFLRAVGLKCGMRRCS